VLEWVADGAPEAPAATSAVAAEATSVALTI
jgi:hypothetical protein